MPLHFLLSVLKDFGMVLVELGIRSSISRVTNPLSSILFVFNIVQSYLVLKPEFCSGRHLVRDDCLHVKRVIIFL